MDILRAPFVHVSASCISDSCPVEVLPSVVCRLLQDYRSRLWSQNLPTTGEYIRNLAYSRDVPIDAYMHVHRVAPYIIYSRNARLDLISRT